MPHHNDAASHLNQDAELDLLDLTCPSCGADLIADELFLSHRMCGGCNRHFAIVFGFSETGEVTIGVAGV